VSAFFSELADTIDSRALFPIELKLLTINASLVRFR
jgi:hypothetical protein